MPPTTTTQNNTSSTTTTTTTTLLWTSKLGNKYNLHEIESAHKQTMHTLSKLRNEPSNRICAECGQAGGGGGGTVWSSVNLGVFTCLRCGSFHRALGTHISKPKGCSGTYLWGPDEIARMQEIGNERAKQIYGGVNERPPYDATDAQWLQYLRDKYEKLKFVPKKQKQQQKQQHDQHRLCRQHDDIMKHNVKEAIVVGHLNHNSRRHPQKRESPPLLTQDLLGLETTNELSKTKHSNLDFFSQFGV